MTLLVARKLTLLASLLFSGLLCANPQGGHVVHGQATITTPSAAHTQIQQSSHKAIIDWQQFSISAGEHTQFVQPSSSAITLNRVIGGNASHIFGRLSANGRLLLINPRGIWLGPTGVIDAASFIASTNNLSNENFLNDRYVFDPLPEDALFGSVINEGQITVKDQGLVALMAPGVANHGIIQANLGQVVLASGNAFTLDFYGDELIHFSIDKAITKKPKDQRGEDMTDALMNSGEIYADGGKVVLSAKAASGIVENSINMAGYIQANHVAQKNGQIRLMANKPGKVRVSGKARANRGSIWVLGKKVHIAPRAELAALDGELLIGGDYQGTGTVVPLLADETIVEQDALLDATGGTVIVWSEGQTHFDGIAKGQLIETSGYYLNLGDNKQIITNPNGMWLIDPFNVFIGLFATVNNSGVPLFTPSGSPSNINVNDIIAQLAGGTNISIATAGAGGDAGNITLSAPINSAGAGSLTLNPTASAIIESNISIAGNLTINGNTVLNGAAPLTLSAAVMTFNGDLTDTMNAGFTSSLTGGTSLSITGSTSLATNVDFGGGTVNIGDSATDTFFNSQVTGFGFSGSPTTHFFTGSMSSGVIFFNANHVVQIQNPMAFSGRIVLNGDITLIGNGNNFAINHSNNFVEPTGGVITINNPGATTTLAIQGGADITLPNTDLDVTGNFVFNNSGGLNVGLEDLTISGHATFNIPTTLALTNDLIINGNTTLNNDLTVTGNNVLFNGATNFGSSSMSLNVANITFAGDVTNTAAPASAVSLTSATSVNFLEDWNTTMDININTPLLTLGNGVDDMLTVNGQVSLTTPTINATANAFNIGSNGSFTTNGATTLNLFGDFNLTPDNLNLQNGIVINANSHDFTLALGSNVSQAGGDVTINNTTDTRFNFVGAGVSFFDLQNNDLIIDGNAVFDDQSTIISELRNIDILTVNGTAGLSIQLIDATTQTYNGVISISTPLARTGTLTLDFDTLSSAGGWGGNGRNLVVNNTQPFTLPLIPTLSGATFNGPLTIPAIVGLMNTNGSQIYNDTVTVLNPNITFRSRFGQFFNADLNLAGNASFISLGGGNTEFTGLITGADNLFFDLRGSEVRFNNPGAYSMNSLTVSNVGGLRAIGTLAINGVSSITTDSTVVDLGPLILNNTLNISAPSIVFNGNITTAAGTPALTATASNAVGTITLNANNINLGTGAGRNLILATQTNGQAILGTPVSLTANTITLPTVVGNGFDLTLNGANNLNGNFSNIDNFGLAGATSITGDTNIDVNTSFNFTNLDGGGFDLTISGPKTLSGNLTNFNNFTSTGTTTLTGNTSITSINNLTLDGVNGGGFDFNINGLNSLGGTFSNIGTFDIIGTNSLNANTSIAVNTLLILEAVAGNGFDLNLNGAKNIAGIFSNIGTLTLTGINLMTETTDFNVNNNLFLNEVDAGGFDLTISGPNTIGGTLSNLAQFTNNGTTTLSGATTINAANGIQFNGNITGSQALTLNTPGHDIVFANPDVSHLGLLTINDVNNITLLPGATLIVAGFNQVTGSGNSNFGTASLNAGTNPVTVVTAGNITGHIVGGNVILVSNGGGTISPDVFASGLSIFGTSGGAMTGAVGGIIIPTVEPFFSSVITLLGGATGAFTFNGFGIGFFNPVPVIDASTVNPYQDDESSDAQARIEEGGCDGSNDEYQEEFEDVFGSSDYGCA